MSAKKNKVQSQPSKKQKDDNHIQLELDLFANSYSEELSNDLIEPPIPI